MSASGQPPSEASQLLDPIGCRLTDADAPAVSIEVGCHGVRGKSSRDILK
jgi:hypothetical protein